MEKWSFRRFWWWRGYKVKRHSTAFDSDVSALRHGAFQSRTRRRNAAWLETSKRSDVQHRSVTVHTISQEAKEDELEVLFFLLPPVFYFSADTTERKLCLDKQFEISITIMTVVSISTGIPQHYTQLPALLFIPPPHISSFFVYPTSRNQKV